MSVTAVDDSGLGSGGMATVLHLVRSGAASTRAELARLSGLGRKAVALRVDHLIASGLVHEGRFGASTGGRLPRELQFAVDGGRLLVAELGSTVISVGVTDLGGRLLHHRTEPADVPAGAEPTLARVEQLFHEMLDTGRASGTSGGTPPLWGIGIGVLGPVDAGSGRPISLPFLPGWGDWPVRDQLEASFGVPVWVDNEVNLMALGEFRGGNHRARNMVYLKLGTGVGAGIISDGRLNRGAGGAAGEVGHISVSDDPEVVCMCGNVGCLLAFAGTRAIAAAGADAAHRGASEVLRQVHEAEGVVDADDVTRAAAMTDDVARAAAMADDVVRAAAMGDKAAIEILARVGDKVGRVAAILVNVHNPSLILIGGSVAAAGDGFLSTIRQSMYQRAFPSSVRDLKVSFSPLSDRAGLIGAAHMVLDEVMSHDALTAWIGEGSPGGHPAVELGRPVLY